MSLLTDCLAAGGTLGIAIGSGLQAFSELRRYGAVARSLGLTQAADAAKELWRSSWRFSVALQLPLSFWPGFSWSIWHLPSILKSFYKANIRYYKAVQAIGSANLTEKFTENDKIAVRELAWKSGYWFSS